MSVHSSNMRRSGPKERAENEGLNENDRESGGRRDDDEKKGGKHAQKSQSRNLPQSVVGT